MNSLVNFYGAIAWFMPIILICVLWDGIWKLIAMWKAGRNNHLAWFICIAIFNTLGILPIIYILLLRDKEDENQSKS